MKQVLFFVCMTLCASSVFSEIVEVYRWKPYPGMGPQLLEDMQQAAQIHNDMGISVQINQLNIGSTQNIDYAMRFDDLESWGRSKDMNVSSEAWASFYGRIAENPSGELVESITGVNTDSSVAASDFENGKVFSVFVWDPAPGRGQELAEGFQVAASIHESLGARVEGYTEGFGGTDMMHYVMIFDSWSHMASVQEKMATSEEWLAFNNATASATEPSAALVQSFTGQTIMNID